jgi:hypothetical protein
MLIEQSVRTIINEAGLGSRLKNWGNKALKTAGVAGALTFPAAATIGIGDDEEALVHNAQTELGVDPESQDRYQDFLDQNNLEDNGESEDMYYARMAESKKLDRISKIIREEISKVV